MYTFKQVSKIDFDASVGCVLLLELDRSNQYWLLNVANKIYGFSIDSTIMINPILTDFKEDNVIFIGIHDFIVAFSKVTGNIQLLSGLLDSFTEVVRINLGYLVVTDTTLLNISEFNFSVNRLISVPDVIENYEITSNSIVIKGVTGEVFKLPFP